MEKDGGREKDQMGRGGTEPRRAVIKTRGKKKCDKREKGNERGIKCWREREWGWYVIAALRGGFLYKRHKSVGGK